MAIWFYNFKQQEKIHIEKWSIVRDMPFLPFTIIKICCNWNFTVIKGL